MSLLWTQSYYPQALSLPGAEGSACSSQGRLAGSPDGDVCRVDGSADGAPTYATACDVLCTAAASVGSSSGIWGTSAAIIAAHHGATHTAAAIIPP